MPAPIVPALAPVTPTRAHEHVLFERQLFQAMGIEVNPDIEKDDEDDVS
jgi:hypothetical protein